MDLKIQQACRTLDAGKLLVYPTESVFGLGCLANNKQALKRLRGIKRREPYKGFIVLCASTKQLRQNFPEICLSPQQLAKLDEAQPHPTTWLLPYKKHLNPLLVGNNNSLAVRITEHPIARILCERCGPLVSSSANPAGIKTPETLLKVRKQFRGQVDFYLDKSLGKSKSPSQIIDLLSGELIRSA